MSRLSYLVDTDWIINQLNRISTFKVRLAEARPAGIGVSVISLAELWDGILFSHDPQMGQVRLEEFLVGVNVIGVSEQISKRFGHLRGTLRQLGRRIPDFDLLIAATAIEHNLTLLTNNRRHFENVPGLNFESL